VGKYSNSSSVNVCDTCPDGQEPNSNKDSCTSCESGKYSNSLTQNVCDVCSPGFQPSEEQDDCVECGIGLYSDPPGGVLLCTRCELIKDLALCETVRTPSSEECFWVENIEWELEGYCIVRVWNVFIGSDRR
jgi:hypothetical protein